MIEKTKRTNKVVAVSVLVLGLGAAQAVALTFSDGFEESTFDALWNISDPSRITISSAQNNTPSGSQSARINYDDNIAEPIMSLDIEGQDVISRFEFAIQVRDTFVTGVPGQRMPLGRWFVPGPSEVVRTDAVHEGGPSWKYIARSENGLGTVDGEYEDIVIQDGLPFNEWVPISWEFRLDGGNVTADVRVEKDDFKTGRFSVPLNPQNQLPTQFQTMANSSDRAEFYLDDVGINLATADPSFNDDFEAGTFDPRYTVLDFGGRVSLSSLQNNTPGGGQSVRINDNIVLLQPELYLDYRGLAEIDKVDFSFNLRDTFLQNPDEFADVYRFFTDVVATEIPDNTLGPDAHAKEIVRVRAEVEGTGTTYRLNFLSAEDDWNDHILATGLPLNDWVDFSWDFTTNSDLAAELTIDGGTPFSVPIAAAQVLPSMFQTMASDSLGIEGQNEFFIDDLNVITVATTGLACDFSGDNNCNATDIDLLAAAVRNGTSDSKFNVDGMGDANIPDNNDYDFYITDDSMLSTGHGDADLNMIVNFNDFVSLSNDFGVTGTGWERGNFNTDDITNFNDFVALSNNFGMNFASGSNVPEPATLVLLGLGGLLLRKSLKEGR